MTLLKRLQAYKVQESSPQCPVAGKLTRVVGLTLEAIGCRAAVGSLCKIETLDGYLEAEVVGFASDKLYLMPSEQLKGVVPGAKVTPIGEEHGVPVGMELLGRVIDGVGTPLDGLGDIITANSARFVSRRLNPLARKPISAPMDVGVRAINALLTVGEGQRMGLFAGSGVGKSVLLGMMTRGTTADVVKFSDDELLFLTDQSDLQTALSWLNEQYNLPLVVITQGKKGALVVHHNEQQLVTGKPVNPVDTTGAGDAFVGGLLAGLVACDDWHNNDNLLKIIRQANACGALATTAKGAMTALPTETLLKAYLAE